MAFKGFLNARLSSKAACRQKKQPAIPTTFQGFLNARLSSKASCQRERRAILPRLSQLKAFL
jgi:hypothetical protein